MADDPDVVWLSSFRPDLQARTKCSGKYETITDEMKRLCINRSN